MKKTVISLMLALAMVFSLVLVAAPVAEAATHTDHCVCGGKTAGVGDHTTCTTLTGWQDLNALVGSSSETTVLASGNYYLSADLNMNITGDVKRGLECAAGSVVNICLNGFKLGCNTRVLYARDDDAEEKGSSITLSISDCKGTGTVTSNNAAIDGSIAYIRNKTTMNVFGGTLLGSSENSLAGGAIRVQSGTFNMYGGTIKDGVSGSLGGNMYVNGAANLYGGTISGGDGVTGGNIHVTATGTLLIDGASVTGGKYNMGMLDNDIDVLGKATIKSIVGTMNVIVQTDGTVELPGLDTAYTKTGTDAAYALTYKAPPAPPAKPNNPATGDSANLVVMGLGLVLGVAGMACLLPKKHG